MAKTNLDEFHDNYGILVPRGIYFIKCPCLTEHSMKSKQVRDTWWLDNSQNHYENYGRREALNLAHATSSHITMKMLAVYRDGNEYHYHDVCKALNIAQGHDIDCWRSLVDRGLIAFSSKRSYGKQYFRITPFGQEVLEIVNANQVYYRVARWFKIKGDDVFTAMMKADLNGEESWRDLLPETINALLEALFNPQSRIHQIGSVYRWMNNFMYLVKSNREFLEKVNVPETRAWLDSHMTSYPGVATFLKKLARINKKNHIA